MLSAAELHRRGVVALNSGRLGQATRLLTRARAVVVDDALRARIEASLAFAATDSADPALALELCERALAFPDLDDETRGILLCQQAAVLWRMGLAPAALEAFGAAIEQLDRLPVDRAKAHLNRGNVHLDLGAFADAGTDFEAAAVLYAAQGESVAEAMARHNLGHVRFREGDLVGALADMERAYRTLGPVSPFVRSICETDRAEVLLAAGLVEEGIALLANAARSLGSRDLRKRQGEAELTLAEALVLHDPAAARRAARSASRRFARLGLESWRQRADAADVFAEIAMGRSTGDLPARAEALAAQLADQGLRWSSTGLTLQALRARARRGEVELAARAVRSVRVPAAAPLDLRLLVREVRADVAVAAGRRTRALAHLRLGLSELHAWQSSFGSLDLQTMVAAHGESLGVRGLALAAGSRDPRVLFEWSERARMLASRVQPVRAPRDESIAADLRELRTLTQDRSGDTDVEREVALRDRVRERAWKHAGSGEVADPVALTELQRGLGPDTALVAHVVTADRVVALVVTGQRVRRHDLAARADLDALLGGLLPDLDMAAAELPAAMARMVRGELADRLDRLADLLVAPLGPDVRERHVVLTPSGVLAGVPWTLLPGLVGCPVTIAQSATSWIGRSDRPLRARTAGFVAGPRVARAEAEVRAVARRWPGSTVLTGTDATAAAVSALAAEVDVLHVAAHGRHSAENPMFSGLQLADGAWFGYDIDQLPAVPDVVLLSACEVGRSSVRAGEELIGMTRAWLHAGARCVVASAAAVNDETAYDVLVAVHEHLAAGLDPAAALARAVPPASADRPPAPFVCFA